MGFTVYVCVIVQAAGDLFQHVDGVGGVGDNLLAGGAAHTVEGYGSMMEGAPLLG